MQSLFMKLGKISARLNDFWLTDLYLTNMIVPIVESISQPWSMND